MKSVDEVPVSEEVETEEVHDNKIEREKTRLKEYSQKRKELKSKYLEAQTRIKQILEDSEREKKRLYELLKEKDIKLSNIISLKDKGKKNVFKFNNLAIIGSSGLFVIAVLLLVRRTKLRQAPGIQEESNEELSEYDKKIKKIEIIEYEISGKDVKENQMALNMLERFLNDNDYRIKLKVIKVLHNIDSKTATDILGRIIRQKKGEYQNEAIKLLGELGSTDSIKLLAELTDSQEDEINQPAIYYLSKIDDSPYINNDLKEKIRNILDEIGSKDKWIVK